jgi:plastocyanin domain-containing protein
MSTIVVPGLWNRPLALKKDQTLVMEFIPQKPGVYQIACAMGVPRGTIKVVK